MYGLHTSKHHSGLTLYFLIKLEIDVICYETMKQQVHVI
ncbi:hypothetical protein JL09_g6985 [Pichia kudriavzevii]|uniref:Uncharacterized protein n=1 Tax=Pichia kudriavzevii TaxID=4909 RepID=A0A099NIB3_PICKU|nr:hypothetical protein JL09_g6985 [Pichia kudriavzevii]